MKEYFKIAFEITNKNMAAASVLVIFMLVLSLYLGFINYAVDTPAEAVLSMFTLLFIVSAFAAGWFYMVKTAVTDPNIGNYIWRSVPDGVGKYFMTFAGVTLLFTVLVMLYAAGVYWLGVTLFGILDFDPELLRQAMISSEGMKIFINSLSEAQLVRLSSWNLLLIVAGWVFSFVLMLWMPEVMAGEKNPAVALWRSVKKLRWDALKLFLCITAANFVLSTLSTFAMYNPVTYFVMMLAYFYFITYVVVLIFYYHEESYSNSRPEG
jgi:hypothetical protein